MNITTEQFNEIKFRIELKNQEKTPAFVQQNQSAITQFKYLHNRKFKCLQLEVDSHCLNTNFVIVDDNNTALDFYHCKTVMSARFNSESIWKFIKKYTEKQ